MVLWSTSEAGLNKTSVEEDSSSPSPISLTRLADMASTSPGRIASGRSIRDPLTKVPFLEPRSSANHSSPSLKMRAWRRDRNRSGIDRWHLVDRPITIESESTSRSKESPSAGVIRSLNIDENIISVPPARGR